MQPQTEEPVVYGYCVKERKKVPIAGMEQVTMKNGGLAIKGHCPDCETKIFKIGKLPDVFAETAAKAEEPFRPPAQPDQDYVQLDCAGDATLTPVGPVLDLAVSTWADDDPDTEPHKLTAKASFSRDQTKRLRDQLNAWLEGLPLRQSRGPDG